MHSFLLLFLLCPLMLLSSHHRRLRPPPLSPPVNNKLHPGRTAGAMLGSLHHHHHNSSSSSDTDTNNDNNNNNTGDVLAAAAPSARDLVLACADLLQRGDLPAARRAAGVLLSAASPTADAADGRLAYHFARALALRADAKSSSSSSSRSPSSSGAYLAFNQIAPFLRFAHLTANQAILDAVDGARRIHILDLDAAHGVQWPPLLQAISDRAYSAGCGAPPPEVRITGAGEDPDTLLRTGSRLRAFARSIHLPFHFTPLLLSSSTSSSATAGGSTPPSTSLKLHPDETLAVNCVMFLHKLGGEDEVAAFFKWVKSMAPAVVTVAERETIAASGGYDAINDLPRRAAVAMDHYAAVFEALEATAPPASRERLAVEQEVLGREIEASLGSSGGRWWRGVERWGAAARAAGFAARPLSAFAVSQARLLLRLHYPSEGYLVQEVRGACFLGWQTRPLLSVSAWQ
ncbi:hypothetical protein HU200_058825 [Digitaria exilis]|uniref:Uncharacterized protein n=1 Tax=Digitaria exilis TaxID=1010633 RepID=A0A835ACX3_9POAL|nr:hypothetical protein HU200_058825 [Digitaria exilis]